MKLIICLLWLWTFSGASAAPNRGRRRHRGILDYFPGCLDLAENSTAFVECMQEHSDERCMNQEMRSEIGSCVLSGFETLRENGLMGPFGMDEFQGGNMNQGGMMNPNAQGANSNGNSMGNAPGGNRMLQGNSGNGGMMGNQGENNGGGMMGNQGENSGGGMMGDGQENNGGGMMGNQGENNGGGMMGDVQGNQGGNNGQANGGMMGNGQQNQGGMMGQGQGFQGMMGNMGPPRPMMEMMANCTEEFRECAREKLEEDIDNLPSCAPESMRNLATCVQNNRDACRESCRGRNASEFRMPHSMPPQSLNNCNGVRNRIYKRICRRGDCCQECFSELESVGTCFVNSIMQHLPENCGMDCESELADEGEEEEENDEAEEGTRRALEFEYIMQDDIDTETLERGWRHLRRALQEDGSSEIFDACIEVAPGLNENNRDAEELALRSDFFDCVVDEMLTIIVNGTETTDDAEANLEFSGAFQTGFALTAVAPGLLFMFA